MTVTPNRRTFSVAVVGATGAVGREIVSILDERRFPVRDLRLFSSSRGAGTTLEFDGAEQRVKELAAGDLDGVDLVLSSPGMKAAAQFTPGAVAAGAVVIDGSGFYRRDDDVPLVVPEVNGAALAGFARRRIVANPSASAIQLALCLRPLRDAAGLRRVVVSTYQSVGGAGQKGMEELERQVRDLFNQREAKHQVFPRRIAFNVIPCIPQEDAFLDDGTTHEEQKLVDETRRLLDLPGLRIHATCVRVPTFSGYSESVTVETERPLAAEAARDALRAAAGVAVLDEPARMMFPTPMDVGGEDLVLVGRVRADPTVPHGVSLFSCADNLRKGAALNMVQIAEALARDHLPVERSPSSRQAGPAPAARDDVKS